jgi:23S rRNA pseudouridine1911/1915/1917 synthase
MKVDERTGKEAMTRFNVLEEREGRALVEARPLTGRTHQIRVHLAWCGWPVVGDPMYGPPIPNTHQPMGLRAVELSYADPFTRKQIRIKASRDDFLRRFGFGNREKSGEGTKTRLHHGARA